MTPLTTGSPTHRTTSTTAEDSCVLYPGDPSCCCACTGACPPPRLATTGVGERWLLDLLLCAAHTETLAVAAAAARGEDLRATWAAEHADRARERADYGLPPLPPAPAVRPRRDHPRRVVTVAATSPAVAALFPHAPHPHTMEVHHGRAHHHR